VFLKTILLERRRRAIWWPGASAKRVAPGKRIQTSDEPWKGRHTPAMPCSRF